MGIVKLHLSYFPFPNHFLKSHFYGREVQDVHPWLIHVNVSQKPPQYCKVVILQLKYNLKINFKNLIGIEYHIGLKELPFKTIIERQKIYFSEQVLVEERE